jgi:hypothetical protein
MPVVSGFFVVLSDSVPHDRSALQHQIVAESISGTQFRTGFQRTCLKSVHGTPRGDRRSPF